MKPLRLFSFALTLITLDSCNDASENSNPQISSENFRTKRLNRNSEKTDNVHPENSRPSSSSNNEAKHVHDWNVIITENLKNPDGIPVSLLFEQIKTDNDLFSLLVSLNGLPDEDYKFRSRTILHLNAFYGAPNREPIPAKGVNFIEDERLQAHYTKIAIWTISPSDYQEQQTWIDILADKSSASRKEFLAYIPAFSEQADDDPKYNRADEAEITKKDLMFNAFENLLVTLSDEEKHWVYQIYEQRYLPKVQLTDDEREKIAILFSK